MGLKDKHGKTTQPLLKLVTVELDAIMQDFETKRQTLAAYVRSRSAHCNVYKDIVDDEQKRLVSSALLDFAFGVLDFACASFHRRVYLKFSGYTEVLLKMFQAVSK